MLTTNDATAANSQLADPSSAPRTHGSLPIEAEVRAEDIEAQARAQDQATEEAADEVEEAGRDEEAMPGKGENAPGLLRPTAP